MSKTGFLPSRHGFHFANAWPPETPDLIVRTPVGNVPIGNAAAGLCGGMCFTAHDFFASGHLPPAGTTPPPTGSPLITYLTRRLLDSWRIPEGVMTYYYWATTPDHDTLLGVRHGLPRMTIDTAIPQITTSIDAGEPCTLGLVTIASADPDLLGHCHQVLAYAYNWNDTYFTVHVYDPNSPDNDTITLGLDISNPGQTTPITSTVNLSAGLHVRGFFFTPYTFHDPAALTT